MDSTCCLLVVGLSAACLTCCLLLHSIPGKSAVPAKPGDRSSHLSAGVTGEAFTFPTAFQRLAVCYSWVRTLWTEQENLRFSNNSRSEPFSLCLFPAQSRFFSVSYGCPLVSPQTGLDPKSVILVVTGMACYRSAATASVFGVPWPHLFLFNMDLEVSALCKYVLA